MTERQDKILRAIIASRTAPVRLIERAQIIRLAFEKKLNQEISNIVPLNPQQVGLWRKRWKAQFERLVTIECNEGPGPLKKAIEDVLADAPRAGRTPRITTDQQAQIVAIACESPEESERPISNWTHREIADEAMKRKIVKTVSPRTVGSFLKPGPGSSTSREVLAQSEAG
jgi:putative transposase